MDLRSFLALVPTKKDLFHDIELQGTADEIQMLEEFCDTNNKKNRMDEAWGHIIYSINERFHKLEKLDFLTDKIISYLLESEIQLISLGHLQLSDEWLLKIYEKDNRCIEAKKTIELRKEK